MDFKEKQNMFLLRTLLSVDIIFLLSASVAVPISFK
jgi:hypothetical protein